MQAQATARSEPSVRTNLLATMIAKVGTGLVNFAAAPLYAALVGFEGYGLIGVYLTLLGFLQIMEVGLTTSASRELAMHSVQAGTAQLSRDFVRTLEFTYWSAAALLGLASPLVSRALVGHWLNFQRIPAPTATAAVIALLITIALQWPSSLYFGGLMGLQRQVPANVIYGAGTLIRVAGSLVVLKFVSASVIAFFLVQAGGTLLTILALAAALWHYLPHGTRRVRFSASLLKGALGLSAGISAISLFSTIFSQVDKVVVSHYVPMESFGQYMLASTLATSVYMLVTPLCAAVFPKLSQCAALGDIGRLKEIYGKSAQLVSAMLAPAVIVTMFLAGRIVLIWTRDAGAAAYGSAIVAALMPATLASGFLDISLGVQRAFGWVRFSLEVTAVSLVFAVPMAIFGVQVYGAVGAAVALAVVRVVMAAVQIIYTHRAVPKEGGSAWQFRAIAVPLLASSGAVIVCRCLFAGAPYDLPNSAAAVALALTLAYAAAALTTPVILTAAGELRRTLFRRAGLA